MLPKHLFLSDCTGDLHDTRVPNWSSVPLRSKYQWHYSRIDTTAQLKATLRAGDVTWPGCYQLHLICSDGASLCFGCAKSEFRQLADSIRSKSDDGWRVVACDINYEDSDLTCSHCNKQIPASYK